MKRFFVSWMASAFCVVDSSRGVVAPFCSEGDAFAACEKANADSKWANSLTWFDVLIGGAL